LPHRGSRTRPGVSTPGTSNERLANCLGLICCSHQEGQAPSFFKIVSENEIHCIGGVRFTGKQMLYSQIVSEISYSPSLEVTFEFIMRNTSISNSRETPSLQFITAARFLKNNAPHLFQIREMGAKSENRMDRWLWDLLK
jgi:hypothetical protein